MYLDSLTELSNAQDVHAGSCASTNSYNFGLRHNYDDGWNSHSAAPNPGQGEPMRVLFTVTTAFTGGTGTYLQVKLQDSADDTTFADLSGGATGQIPVASLVAGYQFELIVPDKCRQYMQAYYSMDAAFGAAAISADIVRDVQTNRVW